MTRSKTGVCFLIVPVGIHVCVQVGGIRCLGHMGLKVTLRGQVGRGGPAALEGVGGIVLVLLTALGGRVEEMTYIIFSILAINVIESESPCILIGLPGSILDVYLWGYSIDSLLLVQLVLPSLAAHQACHYYEH